MSPADLEGTHVAPHPDRPFVWLNCAMSLDGRLAYAGGKRARLSSPEDLARVQILRQGLDAILVGVGTILADDPSLRVHVELLPPLPPRRSSGPDRHPLRVVLDSNGRTPRGAKVLDGSRPTVIVTSQLARPSFPSGVEHVAMGSTRVELRPMLRYLLDRGVRSVMVEGGGQVLGSFLREGLFDRWTLYVAPIVIGESGSPPVIAGPASHDAAAARTLELVSASQLGAGVLLALRPASAP